MAISNNITLSSIAPWAFDKPNMRLKSIAPWIFENPNLTSDIQTKPTHQNSWHFFKHSEKNSALINRINHAVNTSISVFPESSVATIQRPQNPCCFLLEPHLNKTSSW